MGLTSGGSGLNGASGVDGKPVGRFGGACTSGRGALRGGGIGLWKTGALAPGSTVRGGMGAALVKSDFTNSGGCAGLTCAGGIGERTIDGAGGGGSGTNTCGGGSIGRGGGAGIG